jgi:hypothetical protein
MSMSQNKSALSKVFAFALIGLLVLPLSTGGWGFYGHRKINRLAIFTLPEGLFSFYRSHIDFITEHAIDPDKRRYSVIGEAEKHYIDIDHYCKDKTCDPFQEVPQNWSDAVEKFSEDTLRAYGIVPWNIQWTVRKLSDAFREKNQARILRLSAELGHYVADACVPLHTTENYNGQMTNQNGIHGFWESRLPELFDSEYDLFTGKASYLSKSWEDVWLTVKESHYAVDSVLGFEAQLNTRFSEDKKYAYEERGASIMKNYSREYSAVYHEMLDGMVERRMKKAIFLVGSLWYSAWIDAGQPDLSPIENQNIPEDILDEISKESSLPEQEKLKSRSHDN